MKKLVLSLIGVLCMMTVGAQTTAEFYNAYIEKYYKQAQTEQKKHGIPASITLAQGLLESAAGRSELATQANNHFGIKCAGGWTGATFLKDDDAQNECFRKYSRVSDSFEDHSKFLLRDRYKSLFELEPTDYKGWAHGLKQCGYATDPGYAGKLIKIIEDYDLARYDTDTKSSTIASAKTTSSTKQSPTSKTTTKTSTTKTTTKQQPAAYEEPEPEEVVDVAFSGNKKTRKSMAAVDLISEHQVLRNNGRKYIVARQGDTFASLAYEYNIYEKSLRKFNDVVNPRYELCTGDKVYLYPKRSRAQKRYARYRVKRDENIWQIAQDKGMRLKTIYRLNGIREGENVTINQDLRLR